MPTSDVCLAFANFVADTSYDKLPSGAIDAAKKSVLDTFGVILAASGMEPAVRPVVELLKEAGGKPESSVLGWGGRLPASAAAMANGAMAHCLDFDDRTSWGAHSGSSLVPAAFALAERMKGISGRQMIAAIAAGQDLFVRLRCSLGSDRQWNVSTVLGVFSAAAGASHVMRLDRNKIANALGIASMQASGTMQVVYGGGHLRGMYAGFSAQSAVVAALLAHKEVPGIDGVFEGKAGILNAFFEGQYDAEKILAGLGQDYLGATMLYKPWPVVGLAHTYIHATLRLMSRHSLEPASIEQIRVCVAERQLQMCEPLEKRRAPQTAVDAKFSLLYCVAMAAARGEVRVSDFTPTALSDQKVLAMAQRVVPLMDESASVTAKSPVGKVQVLTRDGRTFEELGDNIPGSLEAPMTWEDLARKFVDCAGAAALPVTAAKAQHVVALVERLEELEDATDVIRGLT